MKNVVLLYNTCCIYEISILNYFLSVTGQEVLFVSLDGDEKRATEGYRICPESALSQIKPKETGLVIIPGGDVEEIDRKKCGIFSLKGEETGWNSCRVCAGVDVLEVR